MKKLLLPALLLIISTISAQTIWTVESLPNPKAVDNTYVCNPDNILDATTVRYLNTLLQALEDSTTTQVAVVIVNSIGDEVPEQFRYKLFNYWGVGQKEKDNGLLILMVLDQRRVEFETGYGLEGILTDAMCKRIQVEYMVPMAREEKYGEGLIAGVQQVIQILMDPNYRQEVFDYSLSMYDTRPWYRKTMDNVWMSIMGIVYGLFAFFGLSSRKNKLKKAPAYVKNQINNTYLGAKFALLNLGLPVGFYAWQEIMGTVRVFEFILFAYILFMILLLEKRFRLNRYILKDTKGEEPQDVYNVMSRSHSNGWVAASVFFPLPFILYSIFNKRRLNGLRNSAPLSSDGKTPMVKLNEKGDDEFLKAYQLTEESIHSADYDVWRDMATGAVRIFRFENYYSKYKECPKCKTKAYLMTKNETIKSPTYESSGTGRKTYACKACSFTKSETYTIAKLTRSSSGSGGGFSGGGGGGFGGGSSGGGGAGSGW